MTLQHYYILINALVLQHSLTNRPTVTVEASSRKLCFLPCMCFKPIVKRSNCRRVSNHFVKVVLVRHKYWPNSTRNKNRYQTGLIFDLLRLNWWRRRRLVTPAERSAVILSDHSQTEGSLVDMQHPQAARCDPAPHQTPPTGCLNEAQTEEGGIYCCAQHARTPQAPTDYSGNWLGSWGEGPGEGRVKGRTGGVGTYDMEQLQDIDEPERGDQRDISEPSFYVLLLNLCIHHPYISIPPSVYLFISLHPSKQRHLHTLRAHDFSGNVLNLAFLLLLPALFLFWRV